MPIVESLGSRKSSIQPRTSAAIEMPSNDVDDNKYGKRTILDSLGIRYAHFYIFSSHLWYSDGLTKFPLLSQSSHQEIQSHAAESRIHSQSYYCWNHILLLAHRLPSDNLTERRGGDSSDRLNSCTGHFSPSLSLSFDLDLSVVPKLYIYTEKLTLETD